jgi:pimeloyl-ACP methyl ester carboxylesterase
VTPRIRFFRGEGGRRIAYAVDGAGPVLVLPAWWVSHVERDFAEPPFRDFFERLAARVTVVRYDRWGVGLSDRERTSYRMADDSSDLEALVAELGAEQVALFGMSSGGPLAVSFAARHSERTSHLVLYGTYLTGATLTTDAFKAAVMGLVRAHWGLGANALAELFAPDLTKEEGQRFAAQQRESASAEMAAALLALTYEMDVREQVDLVRTPTLVLHRSKDRAIPFEHGRELASKVAGATFVPLDGAAHLPWLGDAAVIADAILDFVAPSASAATTKAAAGDTQGAFVREGEVWSISFAGRRCHLKHARGLADLAVLLANPNVEIHAMQLMEGLPVTPIARAGADPVLDERARTELRTRLRSLDETIEHAEAVGDGALALRAGEEREALIRELRAATALRGRPRTLAEPGEKARKAVSGRIREAIAKLRELLPDLAHHFDEAIVTGNFCSYTPSSPVRWRT